MSDAAHPLNGPHFVLSSDGELLGNDTAENRELVRRIHACVNACDGISTDELESGIIQDMRRVLAEVVPLLQSQAPGQSKAPSSAQPIVVEQRKSARQAAHNVR